MTNKNHSIEDALNFAEGTINRVKLEIESGEILDKEKHRAYILENVNRLGFYAQMVYKNKIDKGLMLLIGKYRHDEDKVNALISLSP